MSVDRRTFLSGVAALSASAIGSAAWPEKRARERSPRAESASDPTWSKAPCTLCGVGCGLLVGIQNGRAVAVKGDPESPVANGLACAKGYYSVQALYGRDRLTRAKVRTNGTLGDVPVAAALDLVASRLRATIEQHGKDSVALFGSGQWTIPDAYIAAKLFKGAIGTNNVETGTRLTSAAAMAALASTFGLDGSIGCYEDIEHADVIVLWDINLAETDPVLFSRMLSRRRRDPAVRIIDLATRTTRTSYAADRSVLFAPRKMLSIANAICHEVVRREWVDEEFLAHHVAFRQPRADGTSGGSAPDDSVPASWDAYVKYLEAYAPERVAASSGIPAEDIRWLASLYGNRARSVMSVWGANANQHAGGTYLNNALYDIHLLVGKVAAPGNSPFCITGQPSGGAAVHDAGALTETLPIGVVGDDTDRRRAATVWGLPAANIAARPTYDAISMFRAFERGDIRFLWILSADPLATLPNLDRYRRAAAAGDRFIVVSDAYPTPTTDAADVILPSALWIEREGVVASVERRIQHFDRLVEPPGDAMSDARQMIEVARRLGFTDQFAWNDERSIERIWEEYCRFHGDATCALPPLEALRERPGVMWPFPRGRETRWRYNTAHDPAADRSHGDFDFYGHPDHRAWIWLRPNDAPVVPPDEAYPFWLGTGPVLEHWDTGSLTQRVPTLHRAVPRAYLEVNREDAARLGIRHGDMVRVVSRQSSLDIEARVDYRSQPPRGQLFLPSFDESLPVRRLMPELACPVSAQPEMTGCAVRIERLPRRTGT